VPRRNRDQPSVRWRSRSSVRNLVRASAPGSLRSSSNQANEPASRDSTLTAAANAFGGVTSVDSGAPVPTRRAWAICLAAAPRRELLLSHLCGWITL